MPIHNHIPHTQTSLEKYWTNQWLRRISSARTYLKIPVIVPVSGIFISIPGVRTPMPRVNVPAAIVSTPIAPATATPTAGWTPHGGSGWISLFSQERTESIVGELQCPELHAQTNMVPIVPNESLQPVAFFLGNRWDFPQWGISDQNKYSITIRKDPITTQKKTNPQVFISPAKMMIRSCLGLRNTNEHHWPVTPLYYGDDVTRALIFSCTTFAGRNSASNVRTSENNNSNYHLYKALYLPHGLDSLAIPYVKMGSWSGCSPLKYSWRKGTCLDQSWS